MALDSKQKRGSALDMSLPQRQWLAEPDGTLANTDRVSLVKLCSAVTPGGAVSGIPFFFQTDLLTGGMQALSGGFQ